MPHLNSWFVPTSAVVYFTCSAFAAVPGSDPVAELHLLILCLVVWVPCSISSFVYLCLPAAEEETHRQRHRCHRVPGGEHALRARHDPVQLPARVRGGAGGERVHRQRHLQGWLWEPTILYPQHLTVLTFKGWDNLWVFFNIHQPEVNCCMSVVYQTVLPLQVSVTARDDVPFFGPALPDPAIFKKVSSQSHASWPHFPFYKRVS